MGTPHTSACYRNVQELTVDRGDPTVATSTIVPSNSPVVIEASTIREEHLPNWFVGVMEDLLEMGRNRLEVGVQPREVRTREACEQLVPRTLIDRRRTDPSRTRGQGGLQSNALMSLDVAELARGGVRLTKAGRSTISRFLTPPAIRWGVHQIVGENRNGR